MRAFLVVGGVVGMALLGGCAPTKFWSKGYGIDTLALTPAAGTKSLQDEVMKSDANPNGLVDRECFGAPIAADKEAGCRQQRNIAIAALVTASEEMCQVHLKSIYGNDAYYNIMTGTIATLFSGAAAIAGSASGKSALAAISTFANAERSLINETVYKHMLVTATSKKIREYRDTQAIALLLPANFSKSTSDYPMTLALSRVTTYHNSCSFMVGLEKALEEGTDSGIEAKKAKLELEKRRLELDLDNRTAVLTGAGRSADIATDKGILGTKARIEAIEAQLLILVNATTPQSAKAGGAGEGEAPRGDPAALSRAYYSLVAKVEPAKNTLSARINGATPADPARTAALGGKLTANIATLNAALAAPACKGTMDTLNAQIIAQQAQVTTAADDDSRTRAGDKLAPMQVQAGRYTARLAAFEKTYTATTSALVKAIADANNVIDATLKAKIDAGLDSLAVPPMLCAL